MKKLKMEDMRSKLGGVTNRTCMLLGGFTFAAVVSGQFWWGAGFASGAVGSGCFDE